MAQTLRDILKQICEVKQVWFDGLSTGAGTTNTLVCSSLIGRAFGAGMRVQVAGVDREIVSLDRNTGTLTFRPAHSSAIAASTGFMVTPWRWDTMVSAVVRAMYVMGDSWKLSRATETTTSLDGLHSIWDLPSDCLSVNKVQVKLVGPISNVATLGHVQWKDYPFYEVINVDGARKLQMREPVWGPLMVQYQALITIPIEPDDYIQFGENDNRDAVGFVVNGALYELLNSDKLIAPTSEVARVIGDVAQQYKINRENIRAARKPAQYTGQIKRRPMPQHV
ncbi:MAG: hypothetical protein ACKN9T_09430 [Candidatus Methylumidiphilus sp.]